MKPPKPIFILWLLAAAPLLASCSVFHTVHRHHAVEVAAFNTNAGKPVSHFTWVRYPHRVIPISRNQLVAFTDLYERPYLITVGNGCPDLYLHFSGLSSTFGEVEQRYDRVFAGAYVCRIQTIQPVDYPPVERAVGEE